MVHQRVDIKAWSFRHEFYLFRTARATHSWRRPDPSRGCSVGVSLHGAPGIANGIENNGKNSENSITPEFGNTRKKEEEKTGWGTFGTRNNWRNGMKNEEWRMKERTRTRSMNALCCAVLCAVTEPQRHRSVGSSRGAQSIDIAGSIKVAPKISYNMRLTASPLKKVVSLLVVLAFLRPTWFKNHSNTC